MSPRVALFPGQQVYTLRVLVDLVLLQLFQLFSYYGICMSFGSSVVFCFCIVGFVCFIYYKPPWVGSWNIKYRRGCGFVVDLLFSSNQGKANLG